MVSCWLSVVSGQLSVVSGQVSVVSGQKEENFSPTSSASPTSPAPLLPAPLPLYGRWIIASNTRRFALGSVPTKRTYSPGYSET